MQRSAVRGHRPARSIGNVGGVAVLAPILIAVDPVVGQTSDGGFSIGPVVVAVGLTVASVLLLSWVIGRLPGSDENTGAGVFRRRRRDPFGRPPDDRPEPRQRGPFDT
jgi:hypothetical protein